MAQPLQQRPLGTSGIVELNEDLARQQPNVGARVLEQGRDVGRGRSGANNNDVPTFEGGEVMVIAAMCDKVGGERLQRGWNMPKVTDSGGYNDFSGSYNFVAVEPQSKAV